MVGGLNPSKSVFDLSYDKKFTCDMGQIIPIMCEEMVPGDFWRIGNQSITRTQPLVAPILHEVEQSVYYFFVPDRLLWSDFEEFITGGITGDVVHTIPTWEPTDTTVGSLWDYMGFPTGIDPEGAYPVDFPRRAYNFVYNEYFRDESLQTEVALDNETILNACWGKDYFTSALLSQQRGTAPALPISGNTSAVWATGRFIDAAGSTPVGTSPTPGLNNLYVNGGNDRTNLFNMFNSNTVDLSTATTFDIADLRLAFQIQKWMERNNRAGARYTEFLKAHFGVSPRDERLDRPEFIGGSKSTLIFSEVLQTSATASEPTPQGNLAGHGIGVSSAYCGKYHAEEFGVIIGLLIVRPKPAYSQGINRQWLKTTKYDYYFPEFANLSEQAILKAEICARDANPTHNAGIFGYQGRYDEMRYKPNMICGEMRTTYDYWHMARQFDPANPPTLNDDFVKCVPRKDIYAVQDEPGLLVNFGNLIKAYRPIPIMSEPGLIDHN